MQSRERVVNNSGYKQAGLLERLQRRGGLALLIFSAQVMPNIAEVPLSKSNTFLLSPVHILYDASDCLHGSVSVIPILKLKIKAASCPQR